MAWSRVEEVYLSDPFKGPPELQSAFVKLYTSILRFTARSFLFLENKLGGCDKDLTGITLIVVRETARCFRLL